MKNKIELLEERLININDILGAIDPNDFNIKLGKSLITKDKMRTMCDVIIYLQKEISENESATFKDVYKKFEELAPLFDIEKLRSESNISEKEMYLMILSNEPEMQKFCKNLNGVKENQNFLDLNPIADGHEKIIKLKPLELKTMQMETKVMQMTQNVDDLLKNYNETVNVINEKFSLFNKLISNFEGKK